MNQSKFVHVTYIRTTPEKLWQALTEPAFVNRYFFGTTMEALIGNPAVCGKS